MRSLVLSSLLLCIIPWTQGATLLEFLQSRPANFTYAVQAIAIANLTNEFQSGGPYTAFIPTDAAFQKMAPQTLQRLLNDPDALRSLLLKHVTNGVLISPFITTNMQEVSLAQTNMTLSKDSAGVVSIDGAKVILKDQIVSNGVIQAINNVLYVPSSSENIVEYLLRHPDMFKDLTAALTIGDLLKALEGTGPFTVFAPTNKAFQDLSNTLQSIEGNMDLFKQILKYHVISGALYSSSLKDGQKLTTLASKDLTVSMKNGVLVDHAHVIKPDVTVLNGVIHVVDALLVPN